MSTQKTLSISTKELRNNFPLVRDQLERGYDFMLIHRSKPIARIQHINSSNEKEDAEPQLTQKPYDIESIAGSVRIEASIGQPLSTEFLDNLLENKYE